MGWCVWSFFEGTFTADHLPWVSVGGRASSFLFNGGSESSNKDATETFHRRWIAAKAIIGNGRATLITPFLGKLLQR